MSHNRTEFVHCRVSQTAPCGLRKTVRVIDARTQPDVDPHEHDLLLQHANSKQESVVFHP
jgi:hypothetical protein